MGGGGGGGGGAGHDTSGSGVTEEGAKVKETGNARMVGVGGAGRGEEKKFEGREGEYGRREQKDR
ncbi:hypothetical protein GCM10020221_02540 [Streptomyces thioluteus]|uniref:Uncharacterized protein n=1 Tax=Streptomyces thioluteus TaxID=66431 RepID=A0ABN3WC73_STRTU